MLREFFIASIICGTFFCSCKKDTWQRYEINGMVVHNITGQPLPDQTVTVNAYMEKIGAPTPEFPSGAVSFQTYSFQTISDQEGRYRVNIEVPKGNWSYWLKASSAQYIQTSSTARFFPVNPADLPGFRDSIFMEKPAYVKYSINTMGIPAENETLKVRTPYTMKRIPNEINFDPGAFNWFFWGKVNQVVIDTIPGEKLALVPVEWVRMQFDTLDYRRENISIAPYQTTEYQIRY